MNQFYCYLRATVLQLLQLYPLQQLVLVQGDEQLIWAMVL